MTEILLSKGTLARYRDELAAAAREAGIEPRVPHLPDDPKARLAAEDLAGIEIAYLVSLTKGKPLRNEEKRA